MVCPRDVASFEPDIVRYSDDTISVGRSSTPKADGVPPRSPWPLAPSSIDGQMTEWNVMLSLPMK